MQIMKYFEKKKLIKGNVLCSAQGEATHTYPEQNMLHAVHVGGA